MNKNEKQIIETKVENTGVVFNIDDVDVFEENNSIWFCLSDVGKLLELSDSAVRMMKTNNWFDEDEIKLVSKKLTSDTQARKYTYVAESALYRILNKSNSPKAKPFERWVTKEVIPSIRKTGSYTVMPTKSKEELEIESNRIKVEGDKVKIEIANIYMKLSQKYNDNKTYAQILDSYATKSLSDKFVLPLPERTEENFSATEVGKKLGISANSVGKIANKLGIKVDGEYGTWYVDKSPYCNKEVNVFRYNQKAVNLIKKEIM